MEMCRACCTDIELQSLFDYVNLEEELENATANQRIQIRELLETTVQNLPKIQILDELPKKICAACVKKLLDIKKFQNLCMQSDFKMRHLIQTKLKKEELVEPVSLLEKCIKQEVEEYITDDLSKQGETATTTFENEQFEEMELVIKNETDEEDSVDYESISIEDDDVIEQDQNTSSQQQNKGFWRCQNCSREFIYKYSFIKHLRYNSNCYKKKERIKCFFCTRSFALKDTLRKHMKNMHNIHISANKSCGLCSLTFESQSDLDKHACISEYKSERRNRRKTKNFIGSTTTSNTAKKNHVEPERSDSSNLSYETQINISIDQTLDGSDNMKKMNIINNDNQIRGGQIDKTYIEKLIEESYHRKSDAEKRRFKCDLCAHIFTQRKNLTHHLFAKHGVDVKDVLYQSSEQDNTNLICDVCGDVFHQFSAFVVHKALHTEGQRYECGYCKKSYFSEERLQLHKRIHTGDKPHKCLYCPKRYLERKGLIEHLRKHLGENVHECRLCPAAFSKSRQLNSHELLHENDDEQTKRRNKRKLYEARKQLRLKVSKEAKKKSNSKLNKKRF